MLRPIKHELPSHDSMFEETSHRHSQVVKAQRHQRNDERESNQPPLASLAQEQPSATRGTRQSPPKAVGEGTQDEWLDLARVGGLLPIAPDKSPPQHATNVALEQQSGSLTRDLRLAQLERRQHLLSIIFGTLLVGTAVVCTLIVRDQTGRHEQTIAQLQKTRTELRLAQDQQRVHQLSQVSVFDARITTLAQKPEATLRIELPTLVITGTAKAPKTQVPRLPRATSKNAPDLATTEEPIESAATKDVPESVTMKDTTEPAVSKDTTTKPNLRDAIKSSVSKESRPTARLACDKNDPLCGDLS